MEVGLAGNGSVGNIGMQALQPKSGTKAPTMSATDRFTPLGGVEAPPGQFMCGGRLLTR